MNEELLNDLAKAGGSGWIGPEARPGFDALVTMGLVSTDSVVDPEGDVFYALTDTGRKWVEANGKPVAAIKPPPATQTAPVSPAAALPPISSGFDVEEAAWNAPHRKRDGQSKANHEAILAELDLDAAPVGGSKHIAVTADVPKPWLTYYRIISAVNKQFATPRINPADGKPEMKERVNRRTGELQNFPVFDYSRRFIIYQAKKDDPKGPGARIKRVI